MTLRVGKRIIGQLGPNEWPDPLTLPGEEVGPNHQVSLAFGGRVTLAHLLAVSCQYSSFDEETKKNHWWWSCGRVELVPRHVRASPTAQNGR